MNKYISDYADTILEEGFLLYLMDEPSQEFLNLASYNLDSYDSFYNEQLAKIYRMLLDETNFFDLEKETRKIFAKLILRDKKINPDMKRKCFEGSIMLILKRNWMDELEEIKKRIQAGCETDEIAIQLSNDFARVRANPPKLRIPHSDYNYKYPEYEPEDED